MNKHESDRAPEAYQPSNGSEGMSFTAHFCERCVHDRAFRDDPDNEPGCSIYGRAVGYSPGHPDYPPEWVRDPERGPICTAFELDDGTTAPVRCDRTVDMFGED